MKDDFPAEETIRQYLLGRLDDQPDVDFIPRPINTSLGKDECIETFRRDVLRPVNLETRKIQNAIFTRERHKRDVVAIARDKCHRQFLALGLFNGRKSAMTVRGR